MGTGSDQRPDPTNPTGRSPISARRYAIDSVVAALRTPKGAENTSKGRRGVRKQIVLLRRFAVVLFGRYSGFRADNLAKGTAPGNRLVGSSALPLPAWAQRTCLAEGGCCLWAWTLTLTANPRARVTLSGTRISPIAVAKTPPSR